MLSRRSLLALPLLAAAPARAAVPLAATAIDRLSDGAWRTRHLAKMQEARSRPIDLIWLGDSITQNFERDDPQPWAKFRPVWDRFYGHRNALNLGFKGDATCHLLWRMRNGELDGLKPKAAVILIGANNIGRLHWPTPDDVAGIDAVVAEARRRMPTTKLLLLGMLPSERSAWATQTTDEINAALAARYAGGKVSDVTYQDVRAVFLTDGRFDRTRFYDPLLTPPDPPLHPTAQAQAEMCAAIEPNLARLMGA